MQRQVVCASTPPAPPPPVLPSPEAERGPSSEEDGFGFGLGLLEEPEEGVVLYADLPEDLTAIPAGHGELQRVVVGALLEDAEAGVRTDGGTKRRNKRRGEKEAVNSQRDPLSA